MRVLFIARYLQMVNHRKVMALAQYPDLDIWHIAPRRWTDGLRAYTQELEHAEGYHFVPAGVFPRYDIHRFMYWPLSLSLGRIQPDIIHIEEEPDSLAALQAVLARRLWAPKARLILFTWQNIRRPRRQAVEQIARFVLRRVDHTIAGNREAGDVLRMQGYAGPITHLPQLGVDTDIYRPGAPAIPREEPGALIAGYVGRFVPEKGLDLLIDAAARVAGCHLLLVGGGPIQSELEAQVASVGMQERIRFVPPVPHYDVPRYLNAMDVLVLPSRTTPNWKEQFGHVLIEAMACGTPVIGSDSGAIPEVIGPAGMIFAEDDVEALAGRLAQAQGDRAALERLGELGRQRVADTYTHERIAAQTRDVYHAVWHSQPAESEMDGEA